MEKPAHITHDVAGETFNDVLRRYVGRGPGKVSISELADAIDVEARTITAWRDGETVPQWHKMLRLCAYFNPVFTSEILAPAGLGGVRAITPTPVDAPGTASDLAAAVSNLLERLRDGVFCHRDQAVMGPQLQALGQALEAQGRAMCSGAPIRVVARHEPGRKA